MLFCPVQLVYVCDVYTCGCDVALLSQARCVLACSCVCAACVCVCAACVCAPHNAGQRLQKHQSASEDPQNGCWGLEGGP